MTDTLSRTRRGGEHRPLEEGFLYRWAVWAALNPVKVILVWLVLLAGAAVSAGYFTSHLTGNTNSVIGSDSEKAAQLISAEFPDTPSETDFVVLHSTSIDAQDPAFREVVRTAVERYRQAPDVRTVVSPYDAPDRLIAPGGKTALVPVSLDGDDKKLQEQAGPLGEIAEGLGTGQVEAYFTGVSPLAAAAVEQGNEDLSMAETIGFPAAAIVLLLAFGSLVAAAIPLLLGVVAVLAAFGALGIATHFTTFDVFVQTAVSMVGIALGIDYTLFIVTRFREELAKAGDSGRPERARAIGRTVATAGQAVLFSGITVVVSLAGLWLVRSAKVYSMAVGMTVAVLVMMLIAVTLLPALLGLLGPRINRFALPWARRSLAHPDPEHSGWAKAIAVVMRRPLLVAALGTVLLGALSIPVFHLQYGVDLGAGAVAESPPGKGYGIVSEAYAPGVLAPITVVVSAGGDRFTDAQLDAVARFSDQAAGNREAADVVSVTRVLDAQAKGHTTAHLEAATRAAGPALAELVSRDGDTTVVTVRPRHGADTDETADLVRELRTQAGGAFAGTGLTAHVGGGPAEIVDITDESSRAMPLVIGAVLAASWLLLLIAFRSLVLPFEAIFMNLLTSGAAFGAAVLVFQEGHGADLLGVERTGFIQVILPLFAFALVFGLSMDYQVFMLSRMREEWDRTGDNAAAVQLGLTRTAKVITAAAAIMVVVFASFMFTRILEIKQMGFMLALAVLIDATIVRLLLVPSLMRLIGRGNWWLPGWLDRILPRTRH
ncbi:MULTISPECIES: MMPL family transporter [Micromonospora]|uniref:MMPL family transporter n=1 Tax=Micromonospora TaxID=1873 RepID=UPI001AE68E20|nr:MULTISPECIES: MMPL family transporter [unclassified Micromonospora]MBP1784158.1 RND superfamily putative drug exporter [Micromonospora sp. HB375]MDH6467150.1 RND superfamily putative drug exporter [Micromonospora sp. H404/HB375]